MDIALRKNSRGCCSRCKRRSPGYDQLPERVFEFVPLWNIPVFLRYRPRRVSCATCGVIVEEMPWATGKSSLCNCFRVFLAQWARLLSWKEVPARFRVSWDMVFDLDALKRWNMPCFIDLGSYLYRKPPIFFSEEDVQVKSLGETLGT